MKVIRVKDRKARERIERKVLGKRKVLAIVRDWRDIRSEFVKKADVVIVDESPSPERGLEGT